MDKYQLLLDIIEHPERYTPERLREIMSDPETREIYHLLCDAGTAIKANREVDIDAEWDRFARKHLAVKPSRRWFDLFGSRAASIAAIACTSVVAVAAGIAVTMAVTDRNSSHGTERATVAEVPSMIVGADTVTQPVDSAVSVTGAIMFEDEPLERIMKEVASAYGVEVRIANSATGSLRLYYKLDTVLPLDEVISQLNTFEQINIRRDGDTLTID